MFVKHNFIMRYIIIFLSLFLLSCSSSLDKTYHLSNWEQDKIEIEEELGKEDYNLLCNYIRAIRRVMEESSDDEVTPEDIREYMERPLLGKTYRELLKHLKEEVVPLIEKKEDG